MIDQAQIQDKTFTSIVKILPIFISICCIFAIVYSLLTGTPKYGLLVLSIATLISVLLWLYMKNDIEKVQTRFSLDKIHTNTLNRLSHTIKMYVFFFFLLYSISLIILHIREDMYIRPLLFFVVVSAIICILVNLIFKLPPIKTKYSWIILTLSFLVISILIYSQIYIYPSITGIDSWFHQFLTSGLIASGHTPDIQNYYIKFIGYHLIISFTSIISSITFIPAATLSVIFSQITLTIVTFYQLGRMIYNENIGLLSGLCGPLGYLFLVYIFHLMPFSFGLILALFSLLFLLKYIETANRSYILSLIITFISLIVLHPLSSSFFVLVIGILYLLGTLYSIVMQKHPEYINILVIVFLFSTLLLGYWSYTGTGILSIGVEFFDIDAKISMVNPSKLLPYMYIVENAVPHSIIANLYINAHYIVSGFSIIGVLYLLGHLRDRNVSTALLTVLATSFSIAIIGYFVGIDLENQRWLMLGHLVLTIPFSVSIYICYIFGSSTRVKWLLLNIFIFFIVFAVITSSSYDANTPAKSMTVRYSFTDAELTGYQTISGFWDGDIATDSYGRLWLLWTKEYPTSRIISINNNLFDLKFHNDPNLLYIIDHRRMHEPISTSRGSYILNYDAEDYFDKKSLTKTYNSNSVSAYSLLNQ